MTPGISVHGNSRKIPPKYIVAILTSAMNPLIEDIVSVSVMSV